MKNIIVKSIVKSVTKKPVKRKLKKAVKEKTKDAGKNFIKKSIKNSMGKNTDHVFFPSEKSISKDIKKMISTYYRVKEGVDFVRNLQSPLGIYRNIKFVDRKLKLKRYAQKNIDVKLNKTDKRIYDISQTHSAEKGVFSKEELLNDPEMKKAFQIKNDRDGKREFEDTKVLGYFKESKLFESDLEKEIGERYKNKDDAKKAFESVKAKLEKNVLKENLTYDVDFKEYRLTEKGIAEHQEYKSAKMYKELKGIYEYVENNRGVLTANLIERELGSEGLSIKEISKKMNKMISSMDKAVESGLMEKKIGEVYRISEKGFAHKEKYLRKELEKASEYIDNKIKFFKYQGFLNERSEGVFEVTQHFYDKYKDSFGEKGIESLKVPESPKNKVQNKDKKEFEFGYADVRIFRDIEKKNGLTLNELKDGLDKKKEGAVVGRFQKLYENGYIEKAGDKYVKSVKGMKAEHEFFIKKTFEKEQKIKAEFKFTKFDKQILNKADSQNILDIKGEFKKYEQRYKNNEKELKRQKNLLKGRTEKLEMTGYLKKIENEKYVLTGKAVAAKTGENLKELKPEQEKFFKILSEKASINGDLDMSHLRNDKALNDLYMKSHEKKSKLFQFGNYDMRLYDGFQNAVARENDIKNHVINNIARGNDTNKQLNIAFKRLEKNMQEGYLEFDKNIKEYIMTQKGIEKYNEFKKGLNYTEYDRNFITEIIKKNENKLDFKMLKLEVEEISKDNKEYRKNFYNAKKRLAKMEEMELIKKDGRYFSLTEKGIEKALEYDEILIRMEEKKLSKFIERNMNMIEKKDLIAQKEGKYKLTGNYGELKEKFKFDFEDIKLVNAYFENGKLSIQHLETRLKGTSQNWQKRYDKITSSLKKYEKYDYIKYNSSNKRYELTSKGLQKITKTLKDFDSESIRENLKIKSVDSNVIEKHIKPRHSYESKMHGKSRFNKDFDVENEIINMFKKGDYKLIPNLNGEGYIAEKSYGDSIGFSAENKPVNNIRVVLGKDLELKTAFPTNGSLIDKYDVFLKEYSVNKFDYNIIKDAENGLWNRTIFREKNKNLNEKNIRKKLTTYQKRLEKLSEMGLVYKTDQGYKFTKELEYKTKAYAREKEGFFAPSQVECLRGLRDFYNMTGEQINRYICDNIHEKKMEIKHLVKLEYVKLEQVKIDGKTQDIYYLTSQGKRKLNQFEGEQGRKIYDSKIHHRPEELKHDLLVYNAYKDIENKLNKDGNVITNTKTDKDLRAEHSRKKYNMEVIEKEDFADLQVEFKNIKTGEKGVLNIEVDCGYTSDVIKSKDKNIDNLVWYTDSTIQKERILRHAVKSKNVVMIEL